MSTAKESIIHSTPAGKAPTKSNNESGSSRFYLTILCLITGTFLIALDQTIISPAIPSITSEFGALDDISWYGAAYLVTVTALQPTYGKLYRNESIKLTYLTSILIFEAGSLVCGFAPSSTVFIIGRAIAGVGGAGLIQGAFAVITRIVVLQKRPFYIGLTLSTYVVCVCTGPIVGGAFTTDASWRWCFWINVPIGGVVLIVITAILRLPNSKDNTQYLSLPLLKKLLFYDPFGTFLVVGSLICLLLALQWGGITKPWSSADVIGLLAGSAAMASLFCFTQCRLGANALLPTPIIRQRSLAACVLFLFFFFIPTFVYGYWIPIYFQSARRYSPIGGAKSYLSMAIPQIVSMMLAGALASKVGYYVPFIICGTIVSIIGMGFITTLDVDTPTVVWAVIFAFTGLGTGLAQNLPFTAVQVHLREEEVPSGTAILQFGQQLGGSVGHAVSQSIFLNLLQQSIRKNVPQIDPADVLQAGAYNLADLSSSPEVLTSVRASYSEALKRMYIFPLVAACVAFPICLLIENRNIKQEAKDRDGALAESVGINELGNSETQE